VFEDGREFKLTVKEAYYLLKEIVDLPRRKKGLYKVCPTLDIDEEGYIKIYQKTFIPRCKGARISVQVKNQT